jgi:N-acetylmuramoyl-L-alanine amidase
MKTVSLSIALLAFIFSSAQQIDQTFITGTTTGPLPFLQYGVGQDRLGAAKMNYLDTGIVVKVEDSVKDFYKIRLSADHDAYLPKSAFAPDSVFRFSCIHNTSSMKVYGDEKYNYVTLSLDEKLPYKIVQQINPSRIIVDVYGAVSNTNWITQLKTATEIKNVYYEQPESDVFRVIIELQHPQFWGYFVFYNNKSLVIKIKRQPEKLKIKNLLIAVDAGHGGSNSGAKGNSGIYEKDYTLLIAKELEKYLKKKGVKVFMTRNGDEDLTMVDRTLLLRRQEPDLLISIHLNSSSNPAVSGVSTYYRYVGFRPLSVNILDRMLELKLNNFGNVGSFNFSLSGPTEYPNCLVEVAFLSNAEDEKRILDPSFRKDVAYKIYKGIGDWLKEIK